MIFVSVCVCLFKNARMRASPLIAPAYLEQGRNHVCAVDNLELTLRNSSSLEAAGDDHSCRYYNPLSVKKDISENFRCSR